MQRLIQDGLLENRPHRGVFVPELTDEDLADICFAREAIETAALRRVMAAGEAMTVSRRLAVEIDRMAGAPTTRTGMPWSITNSGFTPSSWPRRTVAGCLGCTPSSSRKPGCAGTCSRADSMGRQGLVEEHVALVERLAAKDGGGAHRAIRKHLHGPVKSLARRRGRAEPVSARRPE